MPSPEVEPTSSAIQAARRGESWAEEEIARLIRIFARHVCGANRLAGIPELDWEDVAQEAGHRFFTTGIERFRSGNSGRSYLYAFVKRAYLHLSRGAWRRKQREQKVEPADNEPPNPEVRTVLYGILERLSDSCRTLLQRLYFDGAPYNELAGELELAESSVRARASRCMRKAKDLVR